MIPWTDSIKKSGALTIYIGTLAGSWANVFRDALQEFNVLSSAYKLGVTIKQSKQPPDGDTGANISVETASGPISASYDKETRSENFDGGRLHGRTMLFWRDRKMSSRRRSFSCLASRRSIRQRASVRWVPES